MRLTGREICPPAPRTDGLLPGARRERGRAGGHAGDDAKHGLLVRPSVARRGFILSFPRSLGLPAARCSLRGSNLVRLSSIRYLVGHGRRAAAARPPPPRANGRTSPKRAAINRTSDGGAVATADCNESAIHERAESRVFEMGVGVICRKWIKKRVEESSLHVTTYYILEFQYRSPIENHGHMRPSPSSAAGTSIQCTSTSTLRYSGPQSARGEGGGGAAVGRNRIVNRTLITRSFVRLVYL